MATLEPLGLTFVHPHKLGYGLRHGAFQWAPEWIKSAVVGAWNNVSCHLFGHDRYDIPGEDGWKAESFCASCCKQWEPEY